MAFDGGDLAGILLGGAVGGIGATLLQQHHAVGTARRVRRDEEREAALQDLVTLCAQLEEHVDYMLLPERLARGGVFQTNTMLAAEGIVRNVLSCWRTQAAPYLPRTTTTADDVLAAWHEVQRALDGTNPPVAGFFDRLRDLRATAAALRTSAQQEVLSPTKRARLRTNG